MNNQKEGTMLHKLLVGARLRCPNCEEGRMFDGLFTLHETCPVCGVRFERSEGESIGGTMLLLIFAELLAVGGFFVTEFLFDPPMTFQLIFWVSFNLLFILLGYRHTRGMWIAVVYLTQGVMRDDQARSTWDADSDT